MQEFDEMSRCAVETAKSVLGERKAAEVESLFRNKDALMNLYATLSERDRKTVETVLRNPELLKNILASPKAMEGLQKLLGGMNRG